MPELLELVDAALDKIAFAIFAFAEGYFVFPVGFRWDNGRAVLIFDHLSDPVCVIAPVGEQAGTLGQVLQEKFRHRRIVHLSGRQFELQWKAVFIHPQVKLGGQSSARATDTKISTLFFWAAACWWTRTMVESIICTFSPRASWAAMMASISLSQTPFFRQRLKRL